MALGLGELSLDSYLNEPLKAKVDLLNTGGLHEDQIKIRLATKEDFKRMGVDRAYFLTSISFDVQIDESGSATIVLTSEDAVLEPYLDFIVEARWPSGRLLREYTVLVDPPVFDQTNPVISASERVAAVEEAQAPAKKKQEVVGGTGTRVDVRDSTLPPGAMPQRDFNAATSPTPMPGSRYMIHRDDTLWDIASNARPGNTSVHQTMLDIQRLNPDAFIGGNINRIKAGYIIYLPNESDISSADLSDALSEVREQNKAWRESKASGEDYSSGPSLRISAEPGESAAAGTGAAAADEPATSAAVLEDLEKSELERVEMEQRLVAMEQQVETLQRIVSLKDDQIAALQGAIADGQAAGADMDEAGEIQSLDGTGADMAPGVIETEVMEPGTAVVEAEAPAEPVAADEPAAATPPATEPEATGGFMSYLWYILGALLVAVLGFVLLRRRGEQDIEEPVEVAADTAEDQFADVELTEQTLEVEEGLPSLEEAIEEEPVETAAKTRGYGERKHDEYASDVDASDALAEADIYIAYGRYPQAIDLLKNAINMEPDNSEYRLKLLQLYVDAGNRDAANQQLSDLATINDPDALARAEQIVSGGSSESAQELSTDYGSADKVDSGDLLGDIDDSLEADFSGLEIEEPAAGAGVEDDLDLSVDFDDSDLSGDDFDDELVIAADSNGLSTKLDLARAYLDMGDDDGARQILEEVAAEGNEELQAEARELLERIG